MNLLARETFAADFFAPVVATFFERAVYGAPFSLPIEHYVSQDRPKAQTFKKTAGIHGDLLICLVGGTGIEPVTPAV
jgi:hypothetical protein